MSTTAAAPPRLRRPLHRLELAAITGVISREITTFKTFWKETTVSLVAEPTFYLFAFGVGLGALIKPIDGIDYLYFMGTGMVTSAVLFSPVFSAMYGVFVKYRFQGTYDAILAAPIDVEELVTAEIAWLGARAGVYSVAPLIATMLFGLDPALEMLLVPLIGALTAFGFAGLGVFAAAIVSRIEHFSYIQSALVTPLFLVSGTFFPVDQLPDALHAISNVNPLYHCVQLVRNASFYGFETTDLLRVALLAAFAVMTWRLAIWRLENRLVD